MAQGEFLWCDLGTFNVQDTLTYYRHLFDWDLKPEEFPDGSTYYYASSANEVTAGIYEMPDVYKADGMPSFWMSYIGVDDIVASCEEVEKLGGKVVLGPASFGRGAAIAMIADPFGARFTLFSGSHLQARTTKMVAGGHFWNELYVPDLDAAAVFYSTLFGWKVSKADAAGRCEVKNLAGSPTTAFQENATSPNPLNTPQWTVSFACDDIDRFVKSLSAADRESMLWIKNKQGAAIYIRDPNGAAFVVSQVVPGTGWFS